MRRSLGSGRLGAAVLLGTMAAAMPVAAAAESGGSGVSVAVHTGDSAREGHRVSYAIEVRNTTDHVLPDALVTQRLPPNLAFIAASPTARHEGHRLTWSLTIPAHGTARITMTGAAGRPHRFGSADQALGHGRRHVQIATTVCVREDAEAGAQSCATGRSALREAGSGERWAVVLGALGMAGAVGAVGGWTLRRRRLHKRQVRAA